MVRSRGVVMWDGSVVMTGFFRLVLSWRVRSGLVRDLSLGVCLCSFAGRERLSMWGGGGYILSGGGGFFLCSVACARISDYPTCLIGELPD